MKKFNSKIFFFWAFVCVANTKWLCEFRLMILLRVHKYWFANETKSPDDDWKVPLLYRDRLCEQRKMACNRHCDERKKKKNNRNHHQEMSTFCMELRLSRELWSRKFCVACLKQCSSFASIKNPLILIRVFLDQIITLNNLFAVHLNLYLVLSRICDWLFFCIFLLSLSLFLSRHSHASIPGCHLLLKQCFFFLSSNSISRTSHRRTHH